MTPIDDKTPTFPFSYEIIRSKRKSLAIYVVSGKVEIRSPAKAPNKWVIEFVNEKIPWILKQLANQEEKLKQRLIIADNQAVSFFGQSRTIQIILCPQQKVEINPEHLFIYTRRNTAKHIEKLFNRWLMDQAREYMTTQTIKTARLLGAENKLQDVVFRKTKTKWGHCCHNGNIQYNWLTMMAPKPVVDYLIAHESSHLVHMNHSARFWNTVAIVCPDYKEHKDWLKHNGHRLWTTS